MVSCLILTGPEQWPLNHKKVIEDKKESWLPYDKFPTEGHQKKQAVEMIIRRGDFQTFIYLSQHLGGSGNVAYVAYTPSTADADKVFSEPGDGKFYLDEQLIIKDKMMAGSKKRRKNLIPIKPPGYYPRWDYYDFGLYNPVVGIKDTKEYIKRGYIPRAYNIAIKITAIQKIEPISITEFQNFNNSEITLSQLERSFIVARTKNDYKTRYGWKKQRREVMRR